MCHKENCEKSSLSTLFAIITGIVLAAAAVSAAVFFVLKFIDKKGRCDYIECDCYGDYAGYDAFDDEEDLEEQLGSEPAVEESVESSLEDWFESWLERLTIE